MDNLSEDEKLHLKAIDFLLETKVGQKQFANVVSDIMLANCPRFYIPIVKTNTDLSLEKFKSSIKHAKKIVG